MCGIAGAVLNSQSAPVGDVMREMATALTHRGPDDAGVWSGVLDGVGLAHRRLSILDLSPEGHQPMCSASGRYVVVFNGEIYNFQSLRKALEKAEKAPPWRGHSDTEVLVAAIEAFGVADTLLMLNGMFAIAVIDLQSRMLTLARDRMGEKPLYYGSSQRGFFFASELSAIRAVAGETLDISRDALAAFLRVGYVPGPWSIYTNFFKLRPGTFLEIRLDAIAGNPVGPEQETCFWDIRKIARKGIDAPIEASLVELEATFEQHLREAVRLRMVSDVPLGAFLSGGYDSSAVVALMQSLSPKPVRTFSIGFHEKVFDEAHHARAVAEYLKTEHHELYVSAQEALNVIPQLPLIYSEPFADSSQVPTFLVSKLARQHVTVALSGDGGDELFAGYDRYRRAQKISDYVGYLPEYLRVGMQRCASWAASPRGGTLIEKLLVAFPAEWATSLTRNKFSKLASALASRSPSAIYKGLMSHWDAPEQVVIGATEVPFALNSQMFSPEDMSFVDWMTLIDMESYLPDDILTKVDRASMAASLEARVPLLDHNIVEMAWSLPGHLKLNGGVGKVILKNMVHRYIPKALMDRPKMGFGVPIGEWLRGPLFEWADALLTPSRLRQQGLFSPVEVETKWHQHLKGTHNWQYLLWNVLMFQAWYESLT